MTQGQYVKDMGEALAGQAEQRAVEQVPVNVAGQGLSKGFVSTLGKQVPVVKALFAGKDFVDGYGEANKYFVDPNIDAKISSGTASALNGLSFGLVPKETTAKMLYDNIQKDSGRD